MFRSFIMFIDECNFFVYVFHLEYKSFLHLRFDKLTLTATRRQRIIVCILSLESK